MKALETIRQILDAARNEINRQHPERALEYLREISTDVESFVGHSAWAEHRLLLAEAYAATCSPLAETYFEETVERIARLGEPSSSLGFRAEEHFGDFLATCVHRPSLARRHYEKAKSIAAESNLGEDSARTQLKITFVDLKTDDSPQLSNFRTLKRTAARGGYTSCQQLAAWSLHLGSVSQSQGAIVFARNLNQATDQYFDALLTSTRAEDQ